MSVTRYPIRFVIEAKYKEKEQERIYDAAFNVMPLSRFFKHIFILHRAILVSLDMRYARKVKLAFIV